MAIVRGSAQPDDLLGTMAADRIFGFGGGDILRARAGDDEARGGGGGDLLLGEAGDDRLFGESGDDEFQGAEGDDRLFGGGGDDRFRDQAFSLGDGDDLYDGGAGRDILDFGFNGSGIVLTLGADGSGQARDRSEVDTVRGIEIFLGQRDDDRFTGNGSANEFDGRGGADRLFGGGGDDVLRTEGSVADVFDPQPSAVLGGGTGNDTLVGGLGGDRLQGGAGADELNGGRAFDVGTGTLDVIDMGADANADTLHAVIDRSPVDGEFAYGFGVDRVVNFRAEDRLDISINDGLSTDIFSVKDNIDSNGNGMVDAADDHVARSGQSLVIDVRSLFQSEAEGLDDSFLGFSDPFDKAIVLVSVTRFDVDQIV